MRKTKIVCTLGPATDNEDVLRKLMLAGMNVARLNFSHGTHEEQKKRMDMVKKLRAELGLPIAILLDTKGPEIRTRDFEGGKAELKAGDFFTLTTRDLVGDSTITSITYKDLYKDVQIGTHILIDDGLIELQVTSISGEDILCTVITGGPVSNHKGINVPDVHLNMPYLSEVDQSDILFGIEQDVDFIAASFVRSAKDVLEIRELLNANGGNNINIISKIENSEGVNHIDDIIYVSDGIMVARGDMGVEIPCEEVPVIQKMIINKVYMAGKQVITATQMLDSMMKNPRPTRAEATDVANAAYYQEIVLKISKSAERKKENVLLTNAKDWIFTFMEGVENPESNSVAGTGSSDVATNGIPFWLTVDLKTVKTLTGIQTRHWGAGYASYESRDIHI